VPTNIYKYKFLWFSYVMVSTLNSVYCGLSLFVSIVSQLMIY
jgi:hypothetical protein